jgi:uracil-DNA glycosylase
VTTLRELAAGAASCTRCELYKRASQTGEAVFGSRFRVGEHMGKAEETAFGSWRGLVVSTIHPSAVLRGPDPESRERSYAGLVEDLVVAREIAAGRDEAR